MTYFFGSGLAEGLGSSLAGGSEMPSVERRQLIEEVSGISIYEEKKNKALRELERVDERMKEADKIIGKINVCFFI